MEGKVNTMLVYDINGDTYRMIYVHGYIPVYLFFALFSGFFASEQGYNSPRSMLCQKDLTKCTFSSTYHYFIMTKNHIC